MNTLDPDRAEPTSERRRLGVAVALRDLYRTFGAVHALDGFLP